MARKNKYVFRSINGKRQFNKYLQQILGLAYSSIEYDNIINLNSDLIYSNRIVNQMFIEKGQLVAFNDEILGSLLLPFTTKSIDLLGNPLKVQPYSMFGKQQFKTLINGLDCVVIYDNNFYTPIYRHLYNYADELACCKLTELSNINQQKTNRILAVSPQKEISVRNALEDIDNFENIIALNEEFIKELNTHLDAVPFVADKVRIEFLNIWNEILTFLGISNVTVNKRERLISDETERSQGGVLTCRNNRLQPKLDGFLKCQELLGWDIVPRFYDSLETDLKEGEEDES